MQPQELLVLVSQGEGQRAEFKTSLAGLEKGIEALCSFMNGEGGYVFFGVMDDGSVVGVTVGANTLERVAENIARLIDPRVAPAVEQVPLEDKTVIILVGPRRKAGQVFFFKGKAVARVGRATTYLSAQEIRYRLSEESDEKIARSVERAIRENDDRLVREMRSRGIPTFW